MENKFILGDCMDTDNGLPSYPDNYFGFGAIDPPYGIDFQSSWRTESLRFKKIANDKKPFTDFLPVLFDKMKDGGRIVLFYRWDVANDFQVAAAAAGFNVVSELIWDKVIHGMGDLKACPGPQHESAIYLTKGRFEFNGKRPKSIYRKTRVVSSDQIHPNEKPVELYKAIIRDFSTPGDICVDLFVGSGNSLRAYEEIGLTYKAWELDPDYYAAAKNRMAKGIQADLFINQ
jgi:DNA modification methylase